jgi:hypothetical protein
MHGQLGGAAPRTFRIGAWVWIATGVGHLVLTGVLFVFGRPDAARQRAVSAMEGVRVELGGVPRTLHELTQGVNVVMALAVVFGGLACLVVAKAGPVPRALAGLGLAASLVLLGVSVALLPSPPIVLFAVAALAFGSAFAGGRVAAVS